MKCSETECSDCPNRIELIEAKHRDKHGGRVWLPVECGMADDDEKGGGGEC